MDEHERWLATILTSITDGVIAADAMGVVKFVNAAAERISGWQQPEVVGCDLAEIYHAWDESGEAPAEIPPLPSLLEAPEQYRERQIRRLARKDGSSILVEQSIAPISDGSKAVSGSVVVFRELAGHGTCAGNGVNGHDLH